MIYTFKFQDELYRVDLEEEGDQIKVAIDDKEIPVEFTQIDPNLYSIIIDNASHSIGVLKRGKTLEIFINGELYEFESVSGLEMYKKTEVAASGVQEIKSPMPSRVMKITKGEGEEVEEGEGVIVIEAMKMESELKSPIAGKVSEVRVNEGDAVESGTVLLIISSE